MYKLTKDGFVWEVVSHNQVNTRASYQEVFMLNDDDSESLVTDFDNIDPTKTYAVEVDYIDYISSRAILTILIIQYSIEEYETIYDVFRLVSLETHKLINVVRDIVIYMNNNDDN